MTRRRRISGLQRKQLIIFWGKPRTALPISRTLKIANWELCGGSIKQSAQNLLEYLTEIRDTIRSTSFYLLYQCSFVNHFLEWVGVEKREFLHHLAKYLHNPSTCTNNIFIEKVSSHADFSLYSTFGSCSWVVLYCTDFIVISHIIAFVDGAGATRPSPVWSAVQWDATSKRNGELNPTPMISHVKHSVLSCFVTKFTLLVVTLPPTRAHN